MLRLGFRFLVIIAVVSPALACDRGGKQVDAPAALPGDPAPAQSPAVAPAPGMAAAPVQAAPATPGAAPAEAPPGTPPRAAPDVQLLQRGAGLYAGMCAVCHGAVGEGYKADQATALAHPEFLASVSDSFLGTAIAAGRPGTTMSAWFSGRGGPLSVDDIRALIAHMRSWQKTPSVQLDEREARGDAARGKAIFERECQRCHGEKGPYVRLLSRDYLAHVTPGFLRHAIRKGRPPTPMPAYEATLGEAGIEDVVTYLRSLPAFPTPGGPDKAATPPPLPLGKLPLHPKGPAPRDFRVYPEMTPTAVVAREYKRGAKLALLDARVPTDYAAEHIAGAVSVPFYDPGPYLAKLPKDVWLVCYCGCPHAESGALAEKLLQAGFKHVAVMDEGLWEWKAKGHPMRTGEAP